MSLAVPCPCGRTMQVDREAAGLSVACPACGRILTIPLVEADPLPPLPTAELSPDETADAGRTVETNAAPSDPDPATAKSKQPAIGPMLQALLTPRAIHGMLILGGGLSVLGLVVWLCSLGVFENKIVLATALGIGTLSILGTGWLVALRSRYRLAGQALTFLACVVVPLNLWFYHSQHLLTLDHGLWVGGVVCCLLYAATVYVLRDPLFMYAIEAGITLTVVLFLGQLGLATNTSYLCLVLMALGLVSVHAERAFPPDDKVFDRRRFGMPLFWSGHLQTGAALVLLLVVQLADWLLQAGPRLARRSAGRSFALADFAMVGRAAAAVVSLGQRIVAGRSVCLSVFGSRRAARRGLHLPRGFLAADVGSGLPRTKPADRRVDRRAGSDGARHQSIENHVWPRGRCRATNRAAIGIGA